MLKRKLIYASIVFMISTIDMAIGQTELYKQYEHLEDVVVACAMDFPVDTIKVEVTVLEPQTKDAVYYLVKEFNLGIEKDSIDKCLEAKNKGLISRIVHKNDPKKEFGPLKNTEDYSDISILMYNCNTGAVIVFHNIETKERRIIIAKLITGTLRNRKNNINND